MDCCAPSPAFPRTSCARLSPAWSRRSWYSSAACRPRRSTPLSTLWCRTRRMAAFCAAPASNCTRRSPKRSKRILELMDTQPELFARHYAEAGLVEKSVAYWSKAGHRSAARSAMAEAAAQYQRALDQLVLLTDTRDRKWQDLELSGALGAVLTATKGYAAPETGRAYARARK